MVKYRKKKICENEFEDVVEQFLQVRLQVTLNSNFVSFSWMISKILVKVLGMIPGFFCSLSPNIVNVFPEPVCPYAKMHTLKPSIAD